MIVQCCFNSACILLSVIFTSSWNQTYLSYQQADEPDLPYCQETIQELVLKAAPSVHHLNKVELVGRYSTRELLHMSNITVGAWRRRKVPPRAAAVSYSGTPNITVTTPPYMLYEMWWGPSPQAAAGATEKIGATDGKEDEKDGTAQSCTASRDATAPSTTTYGPFLSSFNVTSITSNSKESPNPTQDIQPSDKRLPV
ncbi:hypothetical protein EVAR_62599_1 [Eumeta japonica]|uniref:Uncharacterized protein n=1 Tax=Eumeta variegata TaxID=151549 RepID=A0A4C1ZMX0_EUMVA|nr:hypothetical protein EVAR_62599_1 [Eumeta japonica]